MIDWNRKIIIDVLSKMKISKKTDQNVPWQDIFSKLISNRDDLMIKLEVEIY